MAWKCKPCSREEDQYKTCVMVTDINKIADLENSVDLTLFQRKAKRLEDINNIIAHNLRGIASNIKMLVEVLMKTHVYKTDETCKLARSLSLEQGLSYIEESSSSLINTLNDLMKGVENTTSTKHAHEYCDFAAIVSGISIQLNGFIIEKNASIQLLLEKAGLEYPKCYLESLLYNLISNALKYAKADVAPEIVIKTYQQDGRTILSVKDNGIGIDLEKHGEKLFGFGQTFHEGYDSKGIGLYITQKQVESLGGSISVTSKENEGCEFLITL
jgi:signal transduction histidine kinase